MQHAGVSGSLIASSFLSEVWPVRFADAVAAAERTAPRTALVRWWRRVVGQLGPASSVRSVFDVAALPLLQVLGYDILHVEARESVFTGVLGHQGRPVAVLLVLPWATGPQEYWRHLQRTGRTSGAQWAFTLNGERLQIADVARTWTRRSLDFDFARVLDDEQGVVALWALARAAALERGLDDVARAGDQHTVDVCGAMGDGVLEALGALMRCARPSETANGSAPQTRFDHALTLVFRILFLLFAEARALVPTWQRVYRDAYTIDALYRKCLERPQPSGLWDALMAISRLAHRGCRAGELDVTAFNGRLFSPRLAGAHELRLPDDAVRDALLALTTVPAAQGRRRIAYRDLGVEQLGAVYERVLEYEPQIASNGPALLTRTSRERKSTGSFYTPRSITEFLVRRTLHPLVANRSADEILALRILDPAMGSGAFLVAACRYLANAVERARVEGGEWSAADTTAERRTAARREVAQRCLYGVDKNATAVQLARLSLWLTTLSADRPLTFLDHRLLAGDSLVGATLGDLARQPPRRSGGGARLKPQWMPSLFEEPVARDLATILPARFRIADRPDDTIATVRGKERELANLNAPGSPLSRWKAAADLWTAGWFWPERGISPQVYGELLTTILGGGGTLAAAQRAELVGQANSIARGLRAFHWDLEFPEIFFGRDGWPRPDGGFDAVLGNPPWDVLRADAGSADVRERARDAQKDRLRFYRTAGIYRHQSRGHSNSYQLFVERALQLVRRGGRLGLILPSGIATDHGSATLRRALFERTQVERVFGFTNREAIFPIHRDMRFMLVTATAGGVTERVQGRFGVRNTAWLDTLPDAAADDPPDARPIAIARALLERWDPERLAIPEFESPRDLDILVRVSALSPRLGDEGGWRLRFGRELNATDDRQHFAARSSPNIAEALPIIEGKHLEPFRAAISRVTQVIAPGVATSLVDRGTTFARRRIAYRDVASATNKLTLIAAILPAGAISTHTVFCCKTALGSASQYCLLALLNSLVANYLVRLHVTTHVTASLMARLPVPKPPGDSRDFRQLVSLARTLEADGIDAAADAYAHLNAIAARLYGLTVDHYAHVLSTFPLLPIELRERCLRSYGQATEARRHGG